MKRHSNNTFITYFWTLSLAIILGISPIQNIAASVASSYMKMGSGMMHHKMNHSSNKTTSLEKNLTTDSQEDCCHTSQCDLTHCSGSISAVINSNLITGYLYNLSSTFQFSHLSLTHHFTSSLYRPPKF